MTKERPHFAFVTNIKKLEPNTFELTQGYILRRPSDDEIHDIQEILYEEKIVGPHATQHWEYPLPGGGHILPPVTRQLGFLRSPMKPSSRRKDRNPGRIAVQMGPRSPSTIIADVFRKR